MSNLSQFFSGGGSIKAIQRGTITIAGGVSTGTATITSVVTAKTELRLLGFSTNDTGSGWGVHVPRVDLTNSTTVTATRNSATGGVTSTVSWELTEWN